MNPAHIDTGAKALPPRLLPAPPGMHPTCTAFVAATLNS